MTLIHEFVHMDLSYISPRVHCQDYSLLVVVTNNLKNFIHMMLHLGFDIMPCIKIHKPLVVYILCRNIM